MSLRFRRRRLSSRSFRSCFSLIFPTKCETKRVMKAYIKTFGCQMNVHDSERIADILSRHGYEITDAPRGAEVLIINSCTVREKAWHKAISEAGRLGVRKRDRDDLTIVFAGCAAQQEGDKVFKLIPAVDLVLGPDHYGQLPSLIERVRECKSQLSRVGFDEGRPGDFLSLEPQGKRTGTSAFVTVMKGCSERCTYCIVPFVRGPMRFRPDDDVVREVESLAQNGVREVTLLGQTVNAYNYEGASFADLLARLDRVPGLERVRFTSPHPGYMTKELIESFGHLETLCESIHLPVQSGSSRMLRRMGRRYTAEHFREVVEKLRSSRPDILISTDIIVGFSGETQEDFEQTLGLIEDARFSGVFSFKYSQRPGTPATKWRDDVPEEEKKRRLAALHTVIDRIVDELRAELVGKVLDVLVEGPGRNPGQLTGRARNGQIVNFPVPPGMTLGSALGKLIDVEVVQLLPHSLEGSAILPVRAR